MIDIHRKEAILSKVSPCILPKGCSLNIRSAWSRYVSGLALALVRYNIELHLFTFGQGTEPLSMDC
jgi:hypothetical protein